MKFIGAFWEWHCNNKQNGWNLEITLGGWNGNTFCISKTCYRKNLQNLDIAELWLPTEKVKGYTRTCLTDRQKNGFAYREWQ